MKGKFEHLVSIVTPFYNRYPIVTETFQSLLAQNYTNWEWVIINDHSDNDHFVGLQNLASKDNRVKIFTNLSNSKGANAARNYGISCANGSYIIFLDSDDVLGADCLANRVALMNVNPNLDFGVFQSTVFYKKPHDSNELLVTNLPKEECLYRFLHLDACWWTASGIWKKQSLLEHHLVWDQAAKGYQDVDFHIRALLCGMTYSIFENMIPDSFWRWGMNDNIGSKLASAEWSESNIRLWSKIKQLLIDNKCATSRNMNAIRRRVCETVLYPVREYNFETALRNLALLLKYNAVSLKDLKHLHWLIKIRKSIKPFNKLGYSIYYRLFFANFHTYKHTYFMMRTYNNEILNRD